MYVCVRNILSLHFAKEIIVIVANVESTADTLSARSIYSQLSQLFRYVAFFRDSSG